MGATTPLDVRRHLTQLTRKRRAVGKPVQRSAGIESVHAAMQRFRKGTEHDCEALCTVNHARDSTFYHSPSMTLVLYSRTHCSALVKSFLAFRHN